MGQKNTTTKFKHEGKEKKVYVKKMFDDIAPNYDFLNHLLSFGLDIYWRKKFIKSLKINHNYKIVDLACGTGDVGFEILKKYQINLTNVDISQNMLNIAKEKAKNKKYNDITFIQADAENLPFDNETIDYITIAYGFRNISNHEKALNEFFRILKPGGLLGILEFSKPKSKIFGFCFKYYFHNILPRIASLFSQKKAYQYLPESVELFSSRKQLCRKIIYSGFQRSKFIDLTFGISTIYLSYKSE